MTKFLISAMILIGFVGCDVLQVTQEEFVVKNTQDNVVVSAVKDGDTLFTIDGVGERSVSVSAGDEIKAVVFVYDISGEYVVYGTRVFIIQDGKRTVYKL
jgi:hypothetical protein